MIECESIARKWGNSIGLTIPKEVAEKIKIKENKKIRFIVLDDNNPIRRTFGMLKEWKTPTEQIMKDIRRDSWDE
ncbi:MAG: AbrB/MazE/SpoVT family DNA-binding domain-containing protein [Nanoarchaeota archaeon]